MEYELYLRAASPSVSGARRLALALRDDPDLEGPGPIFRMTLPHGRLEVALHPAEPALHPVAAVDADERRDAQPAHPEPAHPEAAPFGLDLRIPGGANPRLAAAACERAFAWAKDHGLTVYDPQLGRRVRHRDQDAIVTRIRRMADYLTDTVGLDGEAGGAQIEVDRPRPAMPFRTKFYLALAASLILFALLTKLC